MFGNRRSIAKEWASSRMRFQRLIFIIFATASCFTGVSSVSGQQAEKFQLDEVLAEWGVERGVIVTDAAGKDAVTEFGSNLVRALAEAEVVQAERLGDAVVTNRSLAWTIEGQNSYLISGSVKVPVDSGQYSAIKPLLVLSSFDQPLLDYPVIKIVVTPVPPIDFNIAINGDMQTISDRNEYVVKPGHIVVRVTRSGKADCGWQGTLQPKERHELPCAM